MTNQETEDILTNVPGERWLFENRPTEKSETHSRFQNFPFPRVEYLIYKNAKFEIFF